MWKWDPGCDWIEFEIHRAEMETLTIEAGSESSYSYVKKDLTAARQVFTRDQWVHTPGPKDLVPYAHEPQQEEVFSWLNTFS